MKWLRKFFRLGWTLQLATRLLPILAVAVLLLLVSTWWARHWLVDGLTSAVTSEDDTTATQRVRDLAKLDAVALESLVEAATSPRAAIALAARDELDDMVDRWSYRHDLNPRSFDLASRVAPLATSLAAKTGQFDKSSHPWLQRITLNLMELTDGQSRGIWFAIIDDCQRVLAELEPTPTPGTSEVANRWPAQPNVPEGVIVQSPGNWKPTEPLVPSEPTRIFDTPGIPSEPVQAKPRVETIAAVPIAQPTPDKPPAALPLIQADQRLPKSIAPIAEDKIASATDIALFKQLAGDDIELARIAAHELAVRGFGRASQRDARMLLSNSVDDRVALVNVVSTSQELAAGRWLRMLVADGAGQVRAAAVGAMAVASDTVLRELAWQTALNDPDPRVAAWVEQLNEQR